MAATPDTIGAANDVPSPWAYWLPGKVETMLKPGAARSSQSPKELKSTSLPASSVAPTANTSGKAAGYWGTSLPVLPAAATTTTLRAVAYWTAACSSGLNPAPPRDRLITRAPWSTASTMPVATSESKARSPANTLTGMTRPFQDAGHPHAVVRVGRDHPGDERAVALLIGHRRGGGDHVEPRGEAADQVGVGDVDSGVHHGHDLRRGVGQQVPRGGHPDRVQVD